MKASTLSVLLEGSKSIQTYLQIGKESCNLSVRFDQGDAATICGYPMDWLIHDVNIDYSDVDYSLGEECKLDFEEGMLPQFTTYVGPEHEITLLKAVIKSIKSQSKDDMFKEDATKEYRAKCIKACELAIKELEGK